MVKEHCISRG